MQVSSGNGTMKQQVQPLLQTTSTRSVSEILDAYFTKEEVGGPSSFGSHHIKDGMSCLKKAYYAQVKKLVMDRANSMPLDLGSLIHAILALHYGTGGVKTWEPYNYVLPELPDVAAEAHRIMIPYFERWQQQDAETFDVRAVEYEAKGELSSGRKGGKTCPITCRYDTIIAIKEKDALCAPWGPIESGCMILEHKCLVASERIVNYSDGTVYTVGELAERGVAPKVLSIDTETGKLTITQADVPQPNTVRSIYRTQTKSGRSLSTSDNHPFMTPAGWTPAAELTKGGWVAVPRSTKQLIEAGFTDAEVAFVGYMLGDGYCGGPSFTQVDGPVQDAFISTLAKLGVTVLDTASATTARLERRSDRTPSIWMSQAENGPVQQLLERAGLTQSTAHDKHICPELQGLTQRQTGILLGTLWDTDGCVDAYEEIRNGSTQWKPRITYGSRSRALCEGIQTLLLQLGIPSNVTDTSVAYRGARRDYYYVTVVTREGKRRFLTLSLEGHIPLHKASAETLQDVRSKVKSGDNRPIPTDLIKRLIPTTERTGLPYHWFYRNGPQAVEAWAVQEHVGTHEALLYALNLEVWWDRVIAVTVEEPQMTYDLTVPETHNFVANDIITHNTARALTRDLTTGYMFDFQLMTQCLMWKLAGLDDVFGPLRGVRINFLVKTKTPKFQRMDVVITDEEIKRFAKSITKPAIDLWHRRQRKDAHKASKWPMNMASCIGRYGMCTFFDLCESGGSAIGLYRERTA